MSIPCPPIQWPIALDETGPIGDPGIVLSGIAHIGSIPFRIVAVPVEPRLRFMPDYRPDLADEVYDRERLETLLEELGEIADTDHPRIIELGGACYVMWITTEAEPG